MDIIDSFIKLQSETTGGKTISNTKTITGFEEEIFKKEELPSNLNTFYLATNGLTMHWESEKPIEGNQKIYGRINILPSEKVLSDWKGVVYFDKAPEDEMDKFKIVDFFIDEACVGYFHDENKVDLMEYYTFQDEPITLSVNFAGYIELMFEARGFLNWQKILLHLNGEENNTAYLTRFKKYMPQLFPDFKWEKFMAIYDRVRIK